MMFSFNKLLVLFVAAHTSVVCTGLAAPASRRTALGWIGGATSAGFGLISGGGAGMLGSPQAAWAIEGNMDVDDFLRTGGVAMPMGVSGQAGKSKPETGVVLREGTEVSRDTRSGDVFAEILVKSAAGGPMIPVVASFTSPWPLATGTVFDVETRDASTGDSAFLAVTSSVGEGKTTIADLKDSFFVDSLFGPKGRFSFYGTPTDIKAKKGTTVGDYRVIDISFSTLSQSTQTEIPRKAKLVATIPSGSTQAVMLISSASALRWKKGADKAVATVTESFRATAAPQSAMKLRAKERKSDA